MSTEQAIALGLDPRLRMSDLLPILGVSEAEVYRRIDLDKFPKAIRESHRVAVYLLSEIKLALDSGYSHDFSVINSTRRNN